MTSGKILHFAQNGIRKVGMTERDRNADQVYRTFML